jgi:Flp pilus assembly protein TadB
VNRQLKRANEKSEKRREREQTKRKEQRQANRILRTARPRPTEKRSDSSKPSAPRPTPSVVRPWFIRAYLSFSVLVILLQAVAPSPTNAVSMIVYGFFFLTLGYSLCIWLYRRGTPRALLLTMGAGLLLALLVEGLKFVIPTPSQASAEIAYGPNPLYIAAAMPGLLLGAILGQTIYRRT